MTASSRSTSPVLPLRKLVAVAAAVAAQSVFEVAAVETQTLGCVENYDPNVSYFTDSLRASPSAEGDVVPQLEEEINFANDFSITYFKAFKVTDKGGTFLAHISMNESL